MLSDQTVFNQSDWSDQLSKDWFVLLDVLFKYGNYHKSYNLHNNLLGDTKEFQY